MSGETRVPPTPATGAGLRIIVGGLPAAPDDPLPSPVIGISYPSHEEASEAGRLIMSLQNGTRPFQSGNAVYMGDTEMKVRFSSQEKDGPVLCEVFAKGNPKHLTCAFYAAGALPREQIRVFWQLMDVHHSYVLTVARGNEILAKDAYLVKYTIEERGAVR